MQKDTQDFESVWKNYLKHDYIKFDLERLDQDVGKAVAQYFFKAGVASTKRKPEQTPALFKPKESNGK